MTGYARAVELWEGPGSAGCSPVTYAFLSDLTPGSEGCALQRLHHITASPASHCSRFSQEELRLADISANPARIPPFSPLLSRAPASGAWTAASAPSTALAARPSVVSPAMNTPASSTMSTMSLDLAPGGHITFQVQPGSSIVLRLAAPAGGQPLALSVAAAAAAASGPAAPPPFPEQIPAQPGLTAGGNSAPRAFEPQPAPAPAEPGWEAVESKPSLSIRDARWDRPMLPPEWRLTVLQGDKVLREVRLDERAADTLRISLRDGTLTLLGDGGVDAKAAKGQQAAGQAGVWRLPPRQLRRMVRMIERGVAENAAGMRLWSRCGEGLLRKGLRSEGPSAPPPPAAGAAAGAAAAGAPLAAGGAQPKAACPMDADCQPAKEGQQGKDGPDSPAKRLLRELRAPVPAPSTTHSEGEPALADSEGSQASLSQLRVLREQAAATMERGSTSGSEDWARV